GRFVLTPVQKEIPEETPTSGTEGAAGDASGKRSQRTEAARQANMRGELLYKSKKFSEAARQFEQSLKFDSGDSNWPAYLGAGYAVHRAAEADPDLKRALGSDPQFQDLVNKSLAQQTRGTAGSGSPSP